MNRWSSVWFLAAALSIAGCADGAKLIQDREGGGVVAYPYKGEQGSLISSFRKDALALIQQKCAGPYTIVREGETKGRSRVSGTVPGGQDIVQERRWGIEFNCK
jgi:hypothetical protein